MFLSIFPRVQLRIDRLFKEFDVEWSGEREKEIAFSVYA